MIDGSSSPPESGSAPDEAAAPPEPVAAEVTSPPAARTVGERLRAGRERGGFSVPVVAEKLHLDPKVIEALEADRFLEIGAPVYVRGHLKRYAEFVGESPHELINLYNTRVSHTPPPDLTQIPHAERRADPRRLAKPVMIVALAAVFATAIWWVLSGSQPADAPEVAADTPLVPEDSRPVAGSADTLAATPVSLVSSPEVGSEGADSQPSGSGPASAPAGLAGAPAAATTVGAGTSSAAFTASEQAQPVADAASANVRRLRLELTNDSWVEIYDSRGERLFFDVATAGSVQNVEGRPPLRVILGNATGVAVQVDGQPRDIPASAVDGEGARFVVNRSGSLSRAR